MIVYISRLTNQPVKYIHTTWQLTMQIHNHILTRTHSTTFKDMSAVWVKFLILKPNYAHISLLYVHVNTNLQHFIQLSWNRVQLWHIMWDHTVSFHATLIDELSPVCLKSEIHEIHKIQSLSRNPLSNEQSVEELARPLHSSLVVMTVTNVRRQRLHFDVPLATLNPLWTECRPTLNMVFKREFSLRYRSVTM